MSIIDPDHIFGMQIVIHVTDFDILVDNNYNYNHIQCFGLISLHQDGMGIKMVSTTS